MDASLTPEEAKTSAQTVEMEIAQMVPSSIVDRIDQHATGVLMSCPGERMYHWAGTTWVHLTEPPDMMKIVTEVSDSFNSRDGWDARLAFDNPGKPEVLIAGPQRATYVYGPRDEHTLWVSSFSPCFRLPDDMSPSEVF